MASDDIAREHAEPGEHNDQRQVVRRESRSVNHQRADVTVPAENAAVAQHHRQQHEPRRETAQKTKLAFQPRIGQRFHARHPQPHQQQRHNAPHGHDSERGAPRQDVADIGSQRHAEQIGDGHADDHDRHGFRTLPGVGDPLGDDRPHTEECAVGKSRNETQAQQRPVIGSQRSAEITRRDHRRKRQQYLFQRTFPGDEHHKRRAEADAQRIGGNEVPRLRNRDAETAGDIGQNAHHHELRHSERKRSERQGYQTLFHRGTTLTITGCKNNTKGEKLFAFHLCILLFLRSSRSARPNNRVKRPG